MLCRTAQTCPISHLKSIQNHDLGSAIFQGTPQKIKNKKQQNGFCFGCPFKPVQNMGVPTPKKQRDEARRLPAPGATSKPSSLSWPTPSDGDPEKTRQKSTSHASASLDLVAFQAESVGQFSHLPEKESGVQIQIRTDPKKAFRGQKKTGNRLQKSASLKVELELVEQQ